MLYACIRRFDVMDTVGKFLGTKQDLNHLSIFTDNLLKRRPARAQEERMKEKYNNVCVQYVPCHCHHTVQSHSQMNVPVMLLSINPCGPVSCDHVVLWALALQTCQISRIQVPVGWLSGSGSFQPHAASRSKHAAAHVPLVQGQHEPNQSASDALHQCMACAAQLGRVQMKRKKILR